MTWPRQLCSVACSGGTCALVRACVSWTRCGRAALRGRCFGAWQEFSAGRIERRLSASTRLVLARSGLVTPTKCLCRQNVEPGYATPWGLHTRRARCDDVGIDSGAPQLHELISWSSQLASVYGFLGIWILSQGLLTEPQLLKRLNVPNAAPSDSTSWSD